MLSASTSLGQQDSSVQGHLLLPGLMTQIWCPVGMGSKEEYTCKVFFDLHTCTMAQLHECACSVKHAHRQH